MRHFHQESLVNVLISIQLFPYCAYSIASLLLFEMYRAFSLLPKTAAYAGISLSMMAYYKKQSFMEGELVAQPPFGRTINLQKKILPKTMDATSSLESLVLISGSNHRDLAKEISDLIGKDLSQASISRFSDGEVSIRIDDNIRSKHVFVIQSCGTPVNDSIMELLLTISAARRAGAGRVTAVIPYFGYKHHRRGM